MLTQFSPEIQLDDGTSLPDAPPTRQHSSHLRSRVDTAAAGELAPAAWATPLSSPPHHAPPAPSPTLSLQLLLPTTAVTVSPSHRDSSVCDTSAAITADCLTGERSVFRPGLTAVATRASHDNTSSRVTTPLSVTPRHSAASQRLGRQQDNVLRRRLIVTSYWMPGSATEV